MKLLTRQRRMPSMAGFNLEVTGYQEIGEAGTTSSNNPDSTTTGEHS